MKRQPLNSSVSVGASSRIRDPDQTGATNRKKCQAQPARFENSFQGERGVDEEPTKNCHVVKESVEPARAMRPELAPAQLHLAAQMLKNMLFAAGLTGYRGRAVEQKTGQAIR